MQRFDWDVRDYDLFHTITNYIASSNDRLTLPDSMDSIKSLFLGHWIPLRLHEMNTTGCSQVNAADR